MAAQYILEHSSHMTPDPDGFKCSMKNIVKSHLCKPFNVSNFNIRYSLRSVRNCLRDVSFFAIRCVFAFTTSQIVARLKLYKSVIKFLGLSASFALLLGIDLPFLS